MRRFRFRLLPLLRLRSQFERSARRDLANAIAAVETFDQRLAAAARGLEDCATQSAGNDAVGLLARRLEQGLKRHQWRLRSELQKAQQVLDVVRTDYVGKARDLKVLQKLRDDRHATWQQAALHAEQVELDELARLGRASAHVDWNRATPDGGVGS